MASFSSPAPAAPDASSVMAPGRGAVSPRRRWSLPLGEVSGVGGVAASSAAARERARARRMASTEKT